MWATCILPLYTGNKNGPHFYFSVSKYRGKQSLTQRQWNCIVHVHVSHVCVFVWTNHLSGILNPGDTRNGVAYNGSLQYKLKKKVQDVPSSQCSGYLELYGISHKFQPHNWFPKLVHKQAKDVSFPKTIGVLAQQMLHLCFFTPQLLFEGRVFFRSEFRLLFESGDSRVSSIRRKYTHALGSFSEVHVVLFA